MLSFNNPYMLLYDCFIWSFHFSLVNVMPHSVESVYFFWDTDYANLRLGIWSVQKEIEFAKSLPGVDYYYLGTLLS